MRTNNTSQEPQKKQTGRQNKGFTRVLGYFFIIITILVGAGTIAVTSYVAYIAKDVPEINPKDFNIQLTSQFYDDKQQQVSSRYYSENRVWTEYESIPKNYINAIVAIEDKNFWSHGGVDLYGIARAVVANYVTGGISQGASTITQQLARNILIDPEVRFLQTPSRKIKEALIAMNIEEVMSKEEIITYYANVINFGQSAYGIEAAAKTYFNKSLDQLTIEECALLAGMPQSPVYNNPVNYPERALERRNDVLDAMYGNGYITAEELAAAKAIPVTLNVTQIAADPTYGYFIDAAIKEAEEILAEESLPSLFVGGYSIYTTMDTEGQKLIEELGRDPSNFLKDAGGDLAQVAMVVYDQQTGEIKSMLGGRDYVPMGLNRVYQRGRQPGSSFKPIAAYGPAIELGLTANDIYIDGPVNISGYQPKNAGNSYRGEVTVRQAVASSINTVAVQVLNDIGPRAGWEFAKKLGIDLADDEKYYLSIALGGLENGVSTVEMARAFGAFGNEGVLETPHLITKIVNRNGKTVYRYEPNPQQAITPTVAWYITDLLKTVVNSGTGTQAKVSGVNMAGKTGTAQNPLVQGANKDLWFVGYTPEITAAVWMGFDNPSSANAIYNQYGGGYPARLWRSFMSVYLADQAKVDFVKPDPLEIIKKTIIKKNIVSVEELEVDESAPSLD